MLKDPAPAEAVIYAYKNFTEKKFRVKGKTEYKNSNKNYETALGIINVNFQSFF